MYEHIGDKKTNQLNYVKTMLTEDQLAAGLHGNLLTICSYLIAGVAGNTDMISTSVCPKGRNSPGLQMENGDLGHMVHCLSVCLCVCACSYIQIFLGKLSCCAVVRSLGGCRCEGSE